MRLHFVVLSLIGLLSLEPALADEAIEGDRLQGSRLRLLP